MDYRNYNDNELVSFVEENHENARDILFENTDPLLWELPIKCIGHVNIMV